MMPRRAGLALLGIAVLAWAAPARAEVAATVWRADGSLERGTARVAKGALRVDGKPVDLRAATQVILHPTLSVGPPNALRRRDGGVWLGRFYRMGADGLVMRLEPWGERVTVPRAQIAELVFRRRAAGLRAIPAELKSPGLAVRANGATVRGRIARLDGRRLRLTSNLGDFDFRRGSLIRYVYPRTRAAEGRAEGDELGLADGAVLLGRISFQKGRVRLDPPDREARALPLSAIRHIRPREKRRRWLRPRAGEAVRVATDRLTAAGAPPWRRAFPIDSGNALTRGLSDGGSFVLRMSVALAPGAPAAARVIVSADGERVAERKIAESRPAGWRVKVPAGELSIAVRGERPTRVLVGDPSVTEEAR